MLPERGMVNKLVGMKPSGQATDVPEKPSDDSAIIEEVKILLDQATQLLGNIGPGTQ